MEEKVRRIGAEFWESEAGQLAVIAKQYMEAALVLSDAPPEQQRLIFRPTLALAGQALELLLKACISLNGETYPTSGKEGHDITKLWLLDYCAPIRGHVVINSRIAAAIAREKNVYPDVPKHEEVETLIVEYVEELGRLHGLKGYPLRYTAPASTTAPRTPLLVHSLWRTADDLVKRPSDFLLSEFQARILPYC
jgi:hypothetical protein